MIGAGESITCESVKFAERPAEHKQALVKERDSGRNIKLDVPPFAAVPLFNACSVHFTTPGLSALQRRYRRKGGDWQRYAPGRCLRRRGGQVESLPAAHRD